MKRRLLKVSMLTALARAAVAGRRAVSAAAARRRRHHGAGPLAAARPAAGPAAATTAAAATGAASGPAAQPAAAGRSGRCAQACAEAARRRSPRQRRHLRRRVHQGRHASQARHQVRLAATSCSARSTDRTASKIKATILFPNDPRRRLEVIWNNDAARTDLSLVVINGQSQWSAPRGLKLGTPLAALEKINGRPFKLSGFDADGNASVLGWEGGALSSLPGGCKVGIRLDIRRARLTRARRCSGRKSCCPTTRT